MKKLSLSNSDLGVHGFFLVAANKGIKFVCILPLVLLGSVFAQNYTPSSFLPKDKRLVFFRGNLGNVQNSTFVIKNAMTARNLNGPPSFDIYLDSCKLSVIIMYSAVAKNQYVEKNSQVYTYYSGANIYYKQFRYAWYNHGVLAHEVFQCYGVYSGNNKKGVLLMYVFQFGKWR